jgi:glutathione S-transferase
MAAREIDSLNSGTYPEFGGAVDSVAMIVVHHLEKSRSQRILWLLEELGLDYEVRHYKRDPKSSLAPPELLKVHPLGKSPVITDGDMTIAESGAIIEYLVERYGKGALAPAAGTPERLRYTYWLHFAEGSAMLPLVMRLVFDRIESAKLPFFVKPIARGIAAKVKGGFIDPNLTRIVNHIEAELGRSAWFAGDAFTAADIQMSFPVEAMAARVKGPGMPRMADFLERIHARPAYRRALQKGGPFEILKP